MTFKKETLTITYFVEKGCLGKNGEKHLLPFCEFSNKQLNQKHKEWCIWNVHPLIDIHSPHFQYFLRNKKLNNQQAMQYLNALNINIKLFEESTDDFVVDLIEQYFDR